MKFYLVIDQEKEPSVTIVCNRVTGLVTKIEELCRDWDVDSPPLYGIEGNEIVPLELACVDCFFTKEGKVFAKVGKVEYATKLRIKQVAELVDDAFIKINQGCIVRVEQIEKFTVSFGGALRITLKNGYVDYVARREVKAIKRRLGL